MATTKAVSKHQASAESPIVIPPSAAFDERAALDLLCFRNLMRTATDIVYFKDLESRYLRVSRGTADSYGTDDPLLEEGRDDFAHFTSEHAQVARDDEQRIIITGQPMLDSVEHQKWPDRDDTWVSTTKLPMRSETGQIVGTFGVSRDITPRIMAEMQARRATEALEHSLSELRRVEADLRRVLEASPDAIVRFDAQLRFTYINQAALALTGRPAGDFLGRTCREIAGLSPEFVATWLPALTRVLREGAQVEVDLELPGPAGSRWLQSRIVPEIGSEGQVEGVLAVTRDLTKLKVAEHELEHRARHDPLTGLMNGATLLHALREALARMRRAPCILAVLFIDLDGFKAVNDTYGHDEGDRVLTDVSRRLLEACRGQDIVARLGGDEFVIVCEGLHAMTDIVAVAERIAGVLGRPFVSGSDPLYVRASIGIATTSDPRLSAEHLVKIADKEMYAAKAAGGDNHLLRAVSAVDADHHD